MNQHRRLRTDQGLTLIELLIVIVILGILSAIIVFSVEGITDRGEAASCEASAQTIRVAVESYYAQNGEYPTDLGQLQGDESFVSDEPVLSGATYTTASGNTISLGANGAVTDDCAEVGGIGGSGGSSPVTAQVPGGAVSGGQSVTLSATISGTAPTQVQFLVDGSPVGTDNSGPPWSVNWTATSGNHTVVARATINGSPVDSAGVALNVDAAPCTFVSFAPNPINTTDGGGSNQGLQFPQNATVTFSGDCSGITAVQLEIDRGDDGFFFGGDNHGNMSGGPNVWTDALSNSNSWNDNETIAVRITVTGGGVGVINTTTTTQ